MCIRDRYRNLGRGRFEDVTAKAGLAVGRDRWGSGCSLLDIDRDGDLDLFVANYLSLDLARAAEPGQGANCTWKGLPVNCGPKGLATDTNLLYRNNGDGTFTDVALPSGAAYNELGAPQAGMGVALGDIDADGALDILKTHFAGDIPALYRNRGRGLFEDVAVQAGLGAQNRFVQWGAGLPDLDLSLIHISEPTRPY